MLFSIVLLFFITYCIYNYLYNDPVVIFIDGNIGAGKSTLIQMMELQFRQYYYVNEPIHMWKGIVDEHNISLFDNFYKDKKRWGYTFQNMVQMTKFYNYVILFDKIKKDSFFKRIIFGMKAVVVIERSSLMDKNAFASLLHENNYIDDLEWYIYNIWFDRISKIIKTKNVIYVQTHPALCFDRIHNIRCRDEEKTVSIEYLNELHKRHNDILLNDKNMNVLVIDGNSDIINTISNEYNTIRRFISILKN